MIKVIFDNIYSIVGTILLASFIGYITYRNNRKNRIAEASIVFRRKVLAELEGLYPATQHWPENIYPRFSSSIVKIENIATEFRYFIPFYRKRAFDTALKDYRDYCNKTTWDEMFAYNLWPDFPEKMESPRSQFERIVKHLMSFANKD